MNEQDLIASSPLAWAALNKFQTENQQSLEFDNHRFLIDPLSDLHPDQVYRKSAQVGGSVMMIIKSFWLCKYMGANCIYVLPSKNIVNDFVKPKVDPLISSNPAIDALVSRDSVSIKQVGDRFIYFKGAYSERDAISISGDILVLDELDRMPDPTVVNTYDSRLQASKMGWRWRLSNPSQVGFGVDELYTNSDQKCWFVQCRHCNHRMYMDDVKDANYNNHYINFEKAIYACGKCDQELSDQDRRNGEWVAKFPSRNKRGYWFSQMMAPWVTAQRIIDQKNESSIDFYHNYVLGKAYTPSDLIVNRQTILSATSPGTIQKTQVAMGVDQGVKKTWVLGTAEGIFAHGITESWEEIEHLKMMYNAILVMDAMPYQTDPKRLVAKYKGSAFMTYFKPMNGMDIIQWEGGAHPGVVYADRTRIFDATAQEIGDAKIVFREHPNQLEDYIGHWENLYRTTEEKLDGKIKTTWMKKDNKVVDYPFATVYWRMALSKVMGGQGMGTFVEPDNPKEGKPAELVDENGQLLHNLNQQIEEAFENV